MPANVETMMSAGGIKPWWYREDRPNPWGALGTILDAPKVNLDTAVKAGGVDWTVEKLAATAVKEWRTSETGEQYPVLAQGSEDQFCLVRSSDGKVLNVVGGDYHVIQPREAGEFAINIMDVSGAHFETAGSLDGGRIVIFCLALPEEIKIAGLPEEATKWYVGVKNCYGKNASRRRTLDIAINGVRWVCMNTMNAGLASAFRTLSVSHNANATKRIEEARQTLGIVWETVGEFTAELEALVYAPATERTLIKTLEHIWPLPEDQTSKAMTRWKNQADEIVQVWKRSDNLDNIRKTRYGVYQGIAEWSQWVRKFRGSEGKTELQDQMRLSEVLIGRSDEIDGKAFTFLRDSAPKSNKARKLISA